MACKCKGGVHIPDRGNADRAAGPAQQSDTFRQQASDTMLEQRNRMRSAHFHDIHRPVDTGVNFLDQLFHGKLPAVESACTLRAASETVSHENK